MKDDSCHCQYITPDILNSDFDQTDCLWNTEEPKGGESTLGIMLHIYIKVYAYIGNPYRNKPHTHAIHIHFICNTNVVCMHVLHMENPYMKYRCKIYMCILYSKPVSLRKSSL